ncbi:extracellular solute-binding protein [Microvirga sp. M2]|uniref:extracellular solute-binding protein n=1 Tax=Microvirga sp. M2 TaxID=3073270 RepID=UPI0039C09AAB
MKNKATVFTARCAALGLSALMFLAGGSAHADEKIDLPSYYPTDYRNIIEGARSEDGTLVIYSSYHQQAWDPVFTAFRKNYPFVKSVKNLDVEGEEVYQKLRLEASRGRASGDIVEIEPSIGAKLKNEQNLLMAYRSPEASQYPKDIIEPYPNGYQYAISALVIGYNTKVLPKPITSVKDIADQLRAPGNAGLTIGVRNIASAFAFSSYYTLLRKRPELWTEFETILPHAKPEGSSGSLLTKLQTGEYAAAVFMSDATMLPAIKQSAGLLAAVISNDGTPFQGGSVAIAASSRRPNTAKLFLDFMLSQEGQQAILQGGRPAVRSGLAKVEGLYSFEEATKAIPPEAVAIVPYTEIPRDETEEFTKRWSSLLK